jgi:uncharacterized protein
MEYVQPILSCTCFLDVKHEMDPSKSKIVIAGGTGFLGTALIRQFKDLDYEVVVLSRKVNAAEHQVSYAAWDAQSLGPWIGELEGSTAVINLTGRSVNCRYTEANKKEMIHSRVDATLAIGKAIQCCAKPPKVWINASSAAIFGYAEDEVKHEDSPIGEGFVSEICQLWEQAFHAKETIHTRKVILRIGVVLQPKIGLLQPFVNLAKWGLGGSIGTGEQYFSWIHETDFLNIVVWAMNNPVEGTLHATSPFPVRNKDFMRNIRQALSVPFGFPNPVWSVKIGALCIGTEAELVIKGRRVVSKRLQEQGFQFKYPMIKDAMVDLLTVNKHHRCQKKSMTQ